MINKFLLAIFFIAFTTASYADYVPDWQRFHTLNDRTYGSITYDYDRVSLKKVSASDLMTTIFGMYFPSKNFEEDMRPRFLQVFVRVRFSSPYQIDSFIASSELAYIFLDCDSPGRLLDRRIYFKSSFLDGENYTNHTSEQPFFDYRVTDIKSNETGLQFVKMLYQKFGRMCR